MSMMFLLDIDCALLHIKDHVSFGSTFLSSRTASGDFEWTAHCSLGKFANFEINESCTDRA